MSEGGNANCTPSALGCKGMTFVVACFFILIGGALCFGGTQNAGLIFGIIVGVLAVLLALVAFYSTYSRNLQGLWVVMIGAGIMTALAIVGELVLFFLAESKPYCYIGMGVLVISSPVACWLAWDGRGRSLAFKGP